MGKEDGGKNETGNINECGLRDHIKQFGFYLKCNGESMMGNSQKSYIIELTFVKTLRCLLRA